MHAGVWKDYDVPTGKRVVLVTELVGVVGVGKDWIKSKLSPARAKGFTELVDHKIIFCA